MFKIKTMNAIAPAGIETLERRGCTVGENVEAPEGILLRSADLHEYPMNRELLAIARAGAGYNNIPVAECANRGIVVFNAPGANAVAVKEQEIASLVLASRDVLGSIDYVKSIADKGEEIPKLVEKGKSAFTGPELMGKSIGVIGLGAVGALVANAAVSLDMQVWGYDPFMSVDAAWRLSRAVLHASTLDEIDENADLRDLYHRAAADRRQPHRTEDPRQLHRHQRLLGHVLDHPRRRPVRLLGHAFGRAGVCADLHADRRRGGQKAQKKRSPVGDRRICGSGKH